MDSLWFRLFLSCFILVLISPFALAQQPDVRVSPDEPMSYDLPAEIQIQSAATIGSRTLAVWGTTVNDPDSGVVHALVMQMLEDTALLGQQRRFSSREARPYGVCAGSGIIIIVHGCLERPTKRRTGDLCTADRDGWTIDWKRAENKYGSGAAGFNGADCCTGGSANRTSSVVE
jgi:hypothetical protein